MSQFFTVSGAAMLIFCAIWAYSWFEVWRDPKDELIDFYARHPRAKMWIGLLNKLWVPALATGIVLLIVGVMTGGK